MVQINEPVELLKSDQDRSPDKGIGICLSGGGYRAMLFHLGSLLRLLEIQYLGGAGIKEEFGALRRISSVSGGSITSGALGQSWEKINFGQTGARGRFFDNVIGPVRNLSNHTIDVPAVLLGLLPFTSASKQIASSYRKYLFKRRNLSGFPDEPRFVINATNLQSGALWRFMKPYTRDWKVGEIPRKRKEFEIAVAVGASSAFPPILSPCRLRLTNSDYKPDTGGPGDDNLQRQPFTTKPVLSDGGVYDNLGLETVWKRYKTVLVSDAGGAMQPQGKVASNWACQSFRVLNVIDNQVRSLRKRQLISSYIDGTRSGAYWGIRTDIKNYGLQDALHCPYKQTLVLANTPTRLKAMDPTLQEQLINWGYAVCDAAIRAHVDSSITAPSSFPYPEVGVG